MNRAHLFAVLRVAIVGATFVPLAACGGSPFSSGPDRGSVMDREALQLPAAAVRVTGDPGSFGYEAKIAIPNDITTFNPYFQVDGVTAGIHRQLFATLVEYDPVTRDIKKDGGLAEKYDVQDNKVLITMRQGLSFSDGTPIDSGDVLYSFEVAMDQQVASPIADMLSVSGRLPEVRRLDDRTIELEFVDKYPSIGYVLSQMPIISAGLDWQATIDKGHYEHALNFSNKPAEVANIACSGPFKIVSFAPGKELQLQFNPHYWRVDAQGQRLPYVDKLVYQVMPSSDALVKNIADSKTDVAEFIPAAKFEDISKGAGQKYQAKDLGVGYGTWQLIPNMRADANSDRVKATWLRNALFREFLSRSLDRDRMVREVFKGKATPIYGPVTPANQAWYNDNITKYGYDPAQASAARDKAGFQLGEKDGAKQLLDVVKRKVSFNLFFPNDDEGKALADIVVKTLGEQGIPIKAVPVDAGTLLTKYLMTGSFELVLWRSDTPSTDPIAYMPIFMSNGKRHYYLQSEPGSTAPGMEWEIEINRLMRQMQAKTLADERKADFMKVQKLWSDNMPIIYLVADNVLVAAASDLGNMKPVALAPYVTWNMEQVYFKKS